MKRVSDGGGAGAGAGARKLGPRATVQGPSNIFPGRSLRDCVCVHVLCRHTASDEPSDPGGQVKHGDFVLKCLD